MFYDFTDVTFDFLNNKEAIIDNISPSGSLENLEKLQVHPSQDISIVASVRPDYDFFCFITAS